MESKSQIFQKGDPAWHELRAKFITGTEIAGLFGLNPYSSPAKLYANKVNPAFQDNVYTRMGRILEPAVLNFAVDILKVDARLYAEGGDRVYYDESLGLSATPDARTDDALLELKTTSSKNVRKWLEEPPLHYLAQLAAQSCLTGIDKGYLVIMGVEYPQLPGLILENDYMPEIGALMALEIKRFRNHFYSGDLAKKKQYRVKPELCKQMRELLQINLKVVHCDYSPLTLDTFDWGD